MTSTVCSLTVVVQASCDEGALRQDRAAGGRHRLQQRPFPGGQAHLLPVDGEPGALEPDGQAGHLELPGPSAEMLGQQTDHRPEPARFGRHHAGEPGVPGRPGGDRADTGADDAGGSQAVEELRAAPERQVPGGSLRREGDGVELPEGGGLPEPGQARVELRGAHPVDRHLGDLGAELPRAPRRTRSCRCRGGGRPPDGRRRLVRRGGRRARRACPAPACQSTSNPSPTRAPAVDVPLGRTGELRSVRISAGPRPHDQAVATQPWTAAAEEATHRSGGRSITRRGGRAQGGVVDPFRPHGRDEQHCGIASLEKFDLLGGPPVGGHCHGPAGQGVHPSRLPAPRCLMFQRRLQTQEHSLAGKRQPSAAR